MYIYAHAFFKKRSTKYYDLEIPEKRQKPDWSVTGSEAEGTMGWMQELITVLTVSGLFPLQ